MFRLRSIKNQHFNSHAHVERDIKEASKPVVKVISTHTLTWSVTQSNGIAPISNGNFNSHAHVERDIFVKVFDFAIFISTHTLTWSVTGVVRHSMASKSISTHTLTWSVTSDSV